MTPPPPSSSPAPGAQPTDDAQRLIDLVGQQRDLYRNLHQLSDQQQEVIAEGRTEALLELLSERQVIVDQLTAINRDIAPLRSRMSEIAQAAPESQRKQLRTLVDDVQAMLQSIIDRDEQDRKTLEASKAKVGQELARTRTAPAALHAYKTQRSAGPGIPLSAPAGTARFTDARG